MPFTEKGTLDRRHTLEEKLINAIIVKMALSEKKKNLESILGLTLLFTPGYFYVVCSCIETWIPNSKDYDYAYTDNSVYSEIL